MICDFFVKIFMFELWMVVFGVLGCNGGYVWVGWYFNFLCNVDVFGDVVLVFECFEVDNVVDMVDFVCGNVVDWDFWDVEIVDVYIKFEVWVVVLVIM